MHLTVWPDLLIGYSHLMCLISCRQQLIDRKGIVLRFLSLISFRKVPIAVFQVFTIPTTCLRPWKKLIHQELLIGANNCLINEFADRDMDLLELSAYGNVRRGQDSGGCAIQWCSYPTKLLVINLRINKGKEYKE